MASAITREKQIKSWSRDKKLRLILAENPHWQDLSREWEEDPSWSAHPDAKLRPVLKRESE